MTRKVGRMTLAIALIGTGVVFLVDNLLGYSWYLARLWPAVLIILGLEWLYNAEMARREGGRRVEADAGAIILLIVATTFAVSVSNWNWWPNGNQRVLQVNPTNFRLDIGPISSPFNTASREIELTQDLDVAQIQELVVSGSSGTIYVQDGPKAGVQLKVTAWGRNAEDAEAKARETQLKVEGGSRTTVRAVRPASVNYRYQESLLITLPKDAVLTLKVDNASGSVQIADRTGDVTVTNSSGSVRVDRVKGNAELSTASGSVTAAGIQGDLKATSSSGAVVVEQVTGNLQVGSSSGSVTVNGAGGKVSAQTSSGSVYVTTDKVGGDYALNATSGSVRLTMPAAAGVKVDARASSGTVSGPSWLTIGEGRNSGSGTQGDGAYHVEIRTSSGSINIEAR
jgi:DUF4097 and DUF4098 domain-containing protein YvlB